MLDESRTHEDHRNRIPSDQLSAMSYELKECYSRNGKSYRAQGCERFARAYVQFSVLDIEHRVKKWRSTGDASV